MAYPITEIERDQVLRCGADFADFGCAVNRMDIDQLFSMYERCRFLYPAKLERLRPFLPLVRDNWRRTLRAGELLHLVASFDDPSTGAWASVTSWRTTHRGWHPQHLVSTGGAVASRTVLLAGQAVHIRNEFDEVLQNWFRPDNRFAAAVFGTIEQSLEPGTSAVHENHYLMFPLSSVPPPSGRIE